MFLFDAVGNHQIGVRDFTLAEAEAKLLFHCSSYVWYRLKINTTLYLNPSWNDAMTEFAYSEPLLNPIPRLKCQFSLLRNSVEPINFP